MYGDGAPLAHFALGTEEDEAYCSADKMTSDDYHPLSESAQLEQVHVFTRHGDRSPLGMVARAYLERQVVWECNSEGTFWSSISEDGEGDEKTETLTHQEVTSPPSPYQPFSQRLWNGSCVPGQLTPRGSLQHQLLGASLRDIYVDKLKWLPETLNSSAIYARSTDLW
jgi:hypothetical protein